MPLKLFSIVNNKATALAMTIHKPIAVRREALFENWSMYVPTIRLAISGTKFFKTNAFSCRIRSRVDASFAVSVIVTVNSGTIAKSVVNVKLPATVKHLSSTTRRETNSRYAGDR